jgi:hypothetical protein
MDLHIAEDLHLTIDYVTKTAAILAQRRKGKTYTASVVAEELVKAGQPWVALDPTGAWWGLRAGANGSDIGGLPVVILGGQHGDAPLEPGSGRYVAELVVDVPGWYVLDMSLLDTRSAERAFATDFGEALIRRKRQPGKDFPMHLFVDEADMFAPQERDGQGDNRMLGAYQAIVRRGGLHGLGTTLISQRPALLNKSVLTQLDLLILLRLVAGQDQDAVEKNYVRRAGDKEQAAALMDSLASLRLGEAWVWEPGAEPPIFQRVQVRERTTFNSSATPKPGETRVEPRGLADVDLDAVKTAMEDAIERAKADDPAELRKRIRSLERELADRPTEPVEVPTVVEVNVEVPVIHPAAVAAIDRARANISAAVGSAQAALDAAETALELANTIPPSVAQRPAAPVLPPLPATPQRPPKPILAAVPVSGVPASTDDVRLGRAHRAVLITLARFSEGRSKRQIAAMAQVNAKGGHFGNVLSQLRTGGLIVGTGEGPYQITREGIDALGDAYEPLPTGDALLAWWMNQLGSAHQKILRVLVDAYPQAVDRSALADAVGVDAAGGHYGNVLSQLRTRVLIEGKSELRADDDFMAAITAL